MDVNHNARKIVDVINLDINLSQFEKDTVIRYNNVNVV